MTRILVVDNYDSFVYNLVCYLGQLGAEKPQPTPTPNPTPTPVPTVTP